MYTASWRDVVRRDFFGPHPSPRDRAYRFIIRVTLVVFRLFRFQFDVRGQEHVPASGGAVIASNHVSYLDFTFLGLGASPQFRMVRFMAKASVFGHWFAGPCMRAMQHIPVDRKAGAAAFDVAVRALKDGEVVGVFPEATISSSFELKDLKAGAARMAVQAEVPLIPAAVWGGQRIATKGHKVVLRRGVAITVLLGEPIVPGPGEKPQAVLRRLREALEELVEQAQSSYPQQPEGPDDRWWLPARAGGTAPTPEQAHELDVHDVAGRKVGVAKPHPVARLKALATRRRR
ncbi:1-acyl-sn-glycerol-3-phosphate acyltransferase [Modestobacter sp. I12A-02628]|uniref:1-acyl-sn-glycerol-3-phosphate acyltransferase n=1 Tax=Goekera deserti TaxID=2497753 RepID=A0A7K3WEF6_9ACTN|nr:lysophospholipid acyltransferase family protein [Goekera deserti]MPQ99658.1 1-acyl-sn-glycerol-3-phosphate acyltransferase [Goekera deserti]NDI46332.1 1-acyl-sn-glycerol-3-phosphate acyltransferase [Goekera deserti]NEL54736.1 1-acyl-sn-glycerol-3-phosphate acyltransferase [Goekera deserti]